MEEENQEVLQRHICKYCKKGFPCGRSLGGHMRSHMNTETEMNNKLIKKKKKMMMMVSNGGGGEGGCVDNNSSGLMVGYVLRENPKKTWRISDGNLKEEKLICNECGKGFQSSKALFGHMRCHSEKDKVFESLEVEEEEEEEEDSWVENQKLVVMDSDDQSDNETAAAAAEAEASKGKRKMRRRSRRRTTTRYKTSTNAAADTTCSLSNFSNAVSSVSEIEYEQEEVAMSLMMLSRDVTGFNCFAESSGNNSVLLEAKSLSSTIAAKRFRTDGHENVKEKKSRGEKKLRSRVSELETVRFERKRSELDGFESGFLKIGVKKVESADVSVDGFFRDVEFKKSKLVHEAEFEVFDGEFERGSYNKKRVKCSTAELGKKLTKERSDLKFGKYSSSNKSSTRTDSYDPELEIDSCKKARYDASANSEICKVSPKKSKYKCMTCNKFFPSYQALGGHRASHKKIKGCFASKVESSENSIETDITPDPELMKSPTSGKEVELEVTGSADQTSPAGLKKHKHECPICFKVFSSGQALGGHKRSHLVGGSDQTRSNQSIVIQKQVQPEIRDLLDLNLPATGDEEDSNGDHQLGFKPWWVGNNHKHEQLVGLFSN